MKIFISSILIAFLPILPSFSVNAEEGSLAGDGADGCQIEMDNNSGKCGERIDGGYVCYKIINKVLKKTYADCVS